MRERIRDKTVLGGAGWGIVGLLMLTGCGVPVAAGLEEPEANRVVVSLDRADVAATKEVDPASEGRFRVRVARDDVARALGAMHDEGLPRPHPPGVLDAMGKGALVPSQAAEHARYAAGLAGDLERTMEGVEGVVSARVHLNLPPPEPLCDHPPARATAGVLLEHRGATPPLSAEDAARLVAGGAPQLSASDVVVVMVPRRGVGVGGASSGAASAGLAQLGPLAVARGSVHTLQVILGLLLVTLFTMAVGLMALATRVARLRAALVKAGPPRPGDRISALP
jgi:type III secretion protein J